MKNLHNRTSNGANYPAEPIIGRFVSPWDTSGWYSVFANFGVGSRLHSNEEVTATSVPSRFVGADYIMTFNSQADGFEDKQEVDFFCEQDATVAVALDATAALPDWIGLFSMTEDRLVGSDGREYVICEKEYRAGEHVHIPGLSGAGNHFVVIVASRCEAAPATLPSVSLSVGTLSAHERGAYRSELVEVFNDETALSRYDACGCTLVPRESDPKDRFVKMERGSYLAYSFAPMSSRIVMTAKLSCRDGLLMATILGETDTICGAVLDEGMLRTADGEPVAPYEEGSEIALRIVLDTARGRYDIWMNSRLAYRDALVIAESTPVSIAFSADGDATIDNVYLFDDTEVYVAREEFESSVDALIPSKNATLALSDVPFADDRSASLRADEGMASAEYLFSPIRGVLSVETKVHASDDGFVTVPMVTDAQGNVACRIALYRNCLFATDGDAWVELYEGLTDWQYYPAGNWYQIKVSLDTERSLYTLMVDGAVRAKDFRFSSSIESASRLVYTVQGETELLVNRIRIYDAYDFSRGVLPNAPVFDVKDYGAVGDGKTLDMEAIRRAVADAAYTGGTVYVHDGVYLSGEICLGSDMTLFVDRTATIVGSQDHALYPLREPRSSLCAHRQLGRGLVYAENVSNVRVTGGGMMDGSGRYRFKMNDPLADKREADARPDLVYITYSEGITVEHINFKSSCFWTVVPLSSGNVLLRGLNLDCMNTPNRDGIDPVDCHDMTIYGCNIMAGDDGLCFKSSDPVGCYNIDVDDMMIQSLASGIKFGTDTYYCLKNANIRGCTVKNVNRCGISLETVDGAVVEDVLFERIDMTDVGAPVYVVVGDRNRLPRKEGIEERFGYIKNVTFRELRFEKPYPFSYTKDIREIMVVGQNEKQRIENVTFENCRFALPGGFGQTPGCPKTIDKFYPEYDRHGLSAGSAFTVRLAKNFLVQNCEITWDSADVRPEIAYFDYEK